MANNSIRFQLKDACGATILMALLALLVVSMVAATILAAANSTVRQAKADQEFEQEMLSLQSTANFIAEDIRPNDSDDCFKVVASRSVTQEKQADGTYGDPVYGNWGVEAEGSSYFSEQLVDLVRQVYYSDAGSLLPATGDATITSTIKEDAADLDVTRSVDAHFELSENQEEDDILLFTLAPSTSSESHVVSQSSPDVSQTLYVSFTTKSRKSSLDMMPSSSDGSVLVGTEKWTYTWDPKSFYVSDGTKDN